MTSIEAPEPYYCPITYELMDPRQSSTAPVVDKYGDTYQRSAIERWVSEHNSSPISRLPLTLSDLSPNRALADLIEAWLTEHNVAAPPVQAAPPVVRRRPPRQATVTELDFNASQVDDQTALVTIKPTGKRVDNAIIAVVDVSYSMSTEVADGSGDRHGFTRLDLVKHSLKTVIEALEPSDYLTIIAYSTQAYTVLPLTTMTTANRSDANDKVNQLQPMANTNLWAGVQLALQTSQLPVCQTRNTSIMLFTDGQPNVEPSRGTVQSLRQLVASEPLTSATIHCFGYGYELQPTLLPSIANIGQGGYLYIPDASMIGTVFVNWLSNLLNVVVARATLHYGTTTKELGQLHHQQPIQLLVEAKKDTPITLTYDDQTVQAHRDAIVDSDTLNGVHARALFDQVVRRNLRTAQIDVDPHCLNTLEPQLSIFPSQFTSQLCLELVSPDPDQGQVTKAFSRRDWFNRWGIHYLYSLLNAHQLQLCTNFKDPSIQYYATSEFQVIRDRISQLFDSLPPPTPSGNTHSRVRVQNMASYNDEDGGCFAINSTVQTKAGAKIELNQIQHGDQIWALDTKTNQYHWATVDRVVAQDYNSRLSQHLNGTRLTQWHPVWLDGKWQFPAESNYFELTTYQGMVVNLVLKREHRHLAVLVDGVPCCTLGHGLTGPVIEHSYFGDYNRILADLPYHYQTIKGFRRDPVTKQVVGTNAT